MLGLTSTRESPLSRSRGDGSSARHLFEGREESRLPARALLVTGLVVVGIGALAWYYLGPDLKRYMKIQSM
jgi:hypothetical protein